MRYRIGYITGQGGVYKEVNVKGKDRDDALARFRQQHNKHAQVESIEDAWPTPTAQGRQ